MLGVHLLLDGDCQRYWNSEEARTSRMVAIGCNLYTAALRQGAEAFAV